jgi:nucleolar protein 56
MKAWFGERVEGQWAPAGRTPEQLALYASHLDSTGIPKDLDLEQAAIGAGICFSRADYRALLHEAAMALARDRIASMLSTRDADIVQSIRALDTVIEAYNEITERLAEWYGIHYPGASPAPHELISAILAPVPGEVSAGAPLSGDDLEALRGYASTARLLFEERKRLELYITGCMDDVAPNLSGLLGPLLGARLIARAGGLERLAKLPGSTIQVMGAGEALFKHLREGTPPPKHGFIYRHPLISGSPKRLRGKISRMLAGKAAIAARLDFYSGERGAIADEARERAQAIRKGRRRAPDGH